MTPPPAPFIVGVSRSGTTLLRMMLDAHPQLAIPFETHFLNRLVLAGDGLSPAQFLDLVVGTPSWPNLALDADEVARALGEITPFSATEGVRTVYRLCAARAGKARWGDKTPSYLAIMPAIQRLLPEARFVHIVRDGRDTALSFKGLWFGPGDDVKAAARFWNERVRKARAQSAELGHYMEVRYEDLVLDPRAVLTRIVTSLGLDFDPAMLDYERTASERLAEIVRPFGPNGAESLDLDRFKAIYANAQRPPDPQRIGRWRTEMPEADQRAFEAIAGELLADLGYETRFPARPSAAAAPAS